MKLGFYVNPIYLDSAFSIENLMPHISADKNMQGRILLTLKAYLEKNSKVFDETQIIVTGEKSAALPNGTLKGFKRS